MKRCTLAHTHWFHSRSTVTTLWMKLTLQCRWWTSFWRVCELVTSGIQSIKEGNPAKANSLSEASCENLSLSPLPQMFPPFTTSLIDNLSGRHIKDLAAASQPSRTNRPPPPPSAANQLPLNRAHHQLKEGGHRSQKLPLAAGAVKTGQVNAQKKKISEEWLENNRLRKCWTVCWNTNFNSIQKRALAVKGAFFLILHFLHPNLPNLCLNL